MRYIVHKRFKEKALCGAVNLPAMTACDCDGVIIMHNGRPICFVTSESAHQHFAVDEDGKGMIRGKLTQAIQKTLARRDKRYQERWDKIWSDSICQTYRREDYEDYWLWNHAFFQADIDVLRYIAKLIGAKE